MTPPLDPGNQDKKLIITLLAKVVIQNDVDLMVVT
jgi:hypothetical protein